MTPVSVEDQQADACRSAGVVAGLVSMLLSKDVIKISIPASDKLNKAREKKGKPCIRDAYEIRLRFGGAQNAGASREPINGLGRKSPRMHWRRGHYRKHHLDPGRLIPIPPCLINASEEAEAILPKDYVLPARMGWNLRTAAR
jgi:hypothetical protein